MPCYEERTYTTNFAGKDAQIVKDALAISPKGIKVDLATGQVTGRKEKDVNAFKRNYSLLAVSAAAKRAGWRTTKTAPRQLNIIKG